MIIIGLGGNDAFVLNRPSKWKKEISLLIESVNSKFPSATIKFCNIPPIKEFPAFSILIKFMIGNLIETLREELQSEVSKYKRVFYNIEKISLSNWINKFNVNAPKEIYFVMEYTRPS